MSIIGIDIGSSTTKIIEYSEDRIINKDIVANKNVDKILEEFLDSNNIDINKVEKIVLTGISAENLKSNKYNIPIKTVEEFKAIANGGLYLSDKKEALIVSIGTGTAFVKATMNEIKHIGGTGVGAGTLTNLCNKFCDTNSFQEIIELSKQGDLSKIDLRIGDKTTEKIDTLPHDLTLANFGNLSKEATNADIALGILNMIFEVIGMMAAFAIKNDTIKEVVLIGNITVIPSVKRILKKIEETQNIKFIVPENSEFGVVIGAITSLVNN